jgi:deazaflavin-dependent oxidoreductase (nitroreductase family)
MAIKLGHLRNLVPSMILRSPLHGVMSSRYIVLSFKGRRSGKSYSTPVAYLRRGDVLILTTDSHWWSNFLEPSPVTVRLGGRELRGSAQAIIDEGATAEGLAALIEAIPSYGRFAGVRRSPEGRADPEDISREIKDGRVMIRIELQDD